MHRRPRENRTVNPVETPVDFSVRRCGRTHPVADDTRSIQHSPANETRNYGEYAERNQPWPHDLRKVGGKIDRRKTAGDQPDRPAQQLLLTMRMPLALLYLHQSLLVGKQVVVAVDAFSCRPPSPAIALRTGTTVTVVRRRSLGGLGNQDDNRRCGFRWPRRRDRLRRWLRLGLCKEPCQFLVNLVGRLAPYSGSTNRQARNLGIVAELVHASDLRRQRQHVGHLRLIDLVLVPELQVQHLDQPRLLGRRQLLAGTL